MKASFRANWSSPWPISAFFGASLKGYGCAGMGNVEYGLVMQELERVQKAPDFSCSPR